MKKITLLFAILILIVSCEFQNATPESPKAEPAVITDYKLIWEVEDNGSTSIINGSHRVYRYSDTTWNYIYYCPFQNKSITDGHIYQPVGFNMGIGNVYFKSAFYTNDPSDSIRVWIYRHDTLIFYKSGNPMNVAQTKISY